MREEGPRKQVLASSPACGVDPFSGLGPLPTPWLLYLAMGSDPHSPPASCSAFSVKFRFIWEIRSLD